MRYIQRALFVLVFGFFLVFGSVQAGAQESDSASLRSKKENLSEKVQKFEERIQIINNKQYQTERAKEKAKQKVERLRARISNLNAEIEDLNSRISEVQSRISSTKQTIDETRQSIQEQKKKLDRKKRRVARLVKELYQQNTLKNEVYAVAQSKNLAAALNDISRSLTFQEQIKKDLQAIKDHKNYLKQQEKKLARKKSQLSEQRESLEQTRIAKENAMNRSRYVARQKRGEVNQLEKKKKQLSEEEQRLKDKRIEARRALERLERQLANQYGSTACKGTYLWPMQGASKTQGYGQTPYAQQSPYYDSHRGIDLGGVSYGADVRAAQAGTVVSVGSNRLSYGKWVVIEHENGFYSLYAHLSEQNVSQGERVAEGEVIGGMGDSGLSTAPHLHFSMYAPDSLQVSGSPAGAPINPEGCQWK